MTTTWLEGERSFFLGAQAFLIDNDREMASTSSWAAKHIEHNPAYGWVLGRFVEADRPNGNKQLFSLAGLQLARPTITHAPMNMNHAHRRVVGSFVATDLVYPTAGGPEASAGAMGLTNPITYTTTNSAGSVSHTDSFTFTIPDNITLPSAYTVRQLAEAAGEPCPTCGNPIPADSETCPTCDYYNAAKAAGLELNPYIEALGVFWKHYFAEDYVLVQEAHAEGRLYYSMECIPAQIQCAGPEGCGVTYEYAGRQSTTYCEHLNDHVSDKYLIKPHFTAGAILVPPVRPGWTHADVHSLVAQHAQLASDIYTGVSTDMPHLEADQWESIMVELLALATR